MAVDLVDHAARGRLIVGSNEAEVLEEARLIVLDLPHDEDHDGFERIQSRIAAEGADDARHIKFSVVASDTTTGARPAGGSNPAGGVVALPISGITEHARGKVLNSPPAPLRARGGGALLRTLERPAEFIHHHRGPDAQATSSGPRAPGCRRRRGGDLSRSLAKIIGRPARIAQVAAGQAGQRELVSETAAGAPVQASPRRFHQSFPLSFHAGIMPRAAQARTLEGGATFL